VIKERRKVQGSRFKAFAGANLCVRPTSYLYEKRFMVIGVQNKIDASFYALIKKAYYAVMPVKTGIHLC
jgi:hypothetical protein